MSNRCWGEAYVVGISSCPAACETEEVNNILPIFAAVEALRGEDGAGMEAIEIVDNKIRVTMSDGRILETDTISAGLADKELSATSGNPVQNKAIYNAFQAEVERANKSYDKKGSATTALQDAKKYTDTNVSALSAAVGNKVDKVANKGLSTNDYTTTEKAKLKGIEEGAQKNVQPDWDVTDEKSPAYIRNKPEISGGEVVSGVSGVKGNEESSYRTGDVNITKANIGLGNVDNTSDANKKVLQATQDGNGNIITETYQNKLVSGTNIKTINNQSLLGGGNITIEGGGGSETPISWEDITDKPAFKTVATTGSYNDLTDRPTIPSGTITGVSANGTSVATSGVANIPAATTSKYGVTKLSSSTSSTSTTLAATSSAVKAAYDLANRKGNGTITGITMNGVSKGTSGVVNLGTVITAHQDISIKQDKLVSGTNIKTINGTSLLGSGDITIEGGGSSMPIVEVSSDIGGDYDGNTVFALLPNTYYRFTGSIGDCVIYADTSAISDTTVVNEFVAEFVKTDSNVWSDITISPAPYDGGWAEVQWSNGEAPTLEATTVISMNGGLGLHSAFPTV